MRPGKGQKKQRGARYFPVICKVDTGLFHRLCTVAAAPTNGRTALRRYDSDFFLRCSEILQFRDVEQCRIAEVADRSRRGRALA
jgi:hypothetical protein